MDNNKRDSGLFTALGKIKKKTYVATTVAAITGGFANGWLLPAPLAGWLGVNILNIPCDHHSQEHYNMLLSGLIGAGFVSVTSEILLITALFIILTQNRPITINYRQFYLLSIPAYILLELMSGLLGKAILDTHLNISDTASAYSTGATCFAPYVAMVWTALAFFTVDYINHINKYGNVLDVEMVNEAIVNEGSAYYEESALNEESALMVVVK